MNNTTQITNAPSPSEKSFSKLLAEEGYFDRNGNLHLAFVQRSQVDVLARQMAEDGLTSTQLRRFFQHCRGIEAQIKSGQSKWAQVASRFKLLDSAAERARNRPRDSLPDIFYQFIRTNAAAVKTERDFIEGFLPHFEALLGFASAYLKRQAKP